MAADESSVVLRIKRKRTEDPLDALLVAQVYKKACIANSEAIDEGNVDSKNEHVTVERVFKFVGTVPQGDNDKRKDLLAKIHNQSSEHKNLSKAHIHSTETLQERLRQKKKLLHQEARFKVISSHRPNETSTDSQSDTRREVSEDASESPVAGPSDDPVDDVDLEVQRLFSVYDLVRDENTQERKSKEERKARKEQESEDVNTILCNSVKMIREKLTVSDQQQQKKGKDDFVYDFYYPSDSYGKLGDIVEVLPFDSELVHETLADDFGEIYDDEDDSNDESNWRNEYPDEAGSGSDTSLNRRYYEDYGFDSDEEYRRHAFGEDLSGEDD